jgi:hypothetical protein
MLTDAKTQILNDQSVFWLFAAGGFVSDNWYQIIFLGCACVHAYVAFDKNRRDKQAKKDNETNGGVENGSV